MRRIAFALLLVLWPYTTDQAPTHQSDVVKLQWAPCKLDIGPLQRNIHVQLNCAELNVPLDYTDPRCEQTLPLQLVKVNATKKPFMGSIIFNPGGPGVSGIEDLAFTGALYNRYLLAFPWQNCLTWLVLSEVNMISLASTQGSCEWLGNDSVIANTIAGALATQSRSCAASGMSRSLVLLCLHAISRRART